MELAYFTLMEALRVAGYLVIDACGTLANRAITLPAFLHIAFQPAFVNAMPLGLIPAAVSRHILFAGLSRLRTLLGLHAGAAHDDLGTLMRVRSVHESRISHSADVAKIGESRVFSLTRAYGTGGQVSRETIQR